MYFRELHKPQKVSLTNVTLQEVSSLPKQSN